MIEKSATNLKRSLISWITLLLWGLFYPIQGAEDMKLSIDSLQSTLPDSLSGWKLKERTVYDSSTLYEYIDGGAELYLSYGFEGLLNLRYGQPDQPDIIVDIFDMGKSRQAFGVFSHSRELIDSTFGQGSQYTAGLLLFWKGRFYISILASPETAASKKMVFRLAKFFDEQITETGELPSLLGKLPTENLLEESIRYFNHPLWVNTYYFLTEDNIFHIGKNTQAVLAKYRGMGILLLVQYSTVPAAEAAFSDFRETMMPENPSENIIQIEDGSWIAGLRSEKLLMVVFNSPSSGGAIRLLKAVQTVRQ
jgi:hypothetical protein